MINLSWSGKRCRLFSGTQKTLILFSDVDKTYIIYYQFNTLILLIIYIVHISFICCFTGVSVLSTLQVVPKRKYLFCRKICYFQLIVKEKLCTLFCLREIQRVFVNILFETIKPLDVWLMTNFIASLLWLWQ